MIQEDTPSNQRQLVQAPPPNASQDRAFGGFIEGANNVEITGGNFHQTHGHHINLNLAIHLSQPPREEYEVPQKIPLAPASSLSPPPTPYHEPSPTKNQFFPQPAHEQDLSRSTTIYSSDNGNKIYERHLGLKQRGFPLRIPEPNRNLPMPYRRKGVSIGDVGIITPSGGFSFLFNICLPHDDPINPRMLPDGFAPIYPPIEPMDIYEYLFKPASYLASTSIEKTRNDPPFRGLSFTISSAEGALLTLPDGAIAHDLENVERFREYAEANIESWYRYVNGPRGRGAKNGEVRLVIGCDKATSWGMASVANMSQHKTHYIQYRPVAAHERTTTPVPLYEWDYTGPWEASVGPDPTEIEDLKGSDDSDVAKGGKYWNQCLFVRTLNITLSDAAFTKVSRDLRSASAQCQNQGCSTAVISHPADVLNSRIMKEFPNSRVVITQDDDWCSIISKDDNIMSSPSEIAEHVLAAHIIVEKDGVTFLKSKDSHSSLRHSRISSRHSVIGPLDSQNHIAGSSLISLRSTSLATSLMLATPAPSTLGKKGKKVLKRMKKAEDDVFDGYPSDIIIPVMGPTGVGKSTFINTLLNSTQAKAKVGDSLKSCTTQPLPIVIHLGPGRKSSFQNPYGDKNAARLILVDTPGFDHTEIDDMEILRRISVWLGNSYEKGMKLGGVIYLHDITQSRMLGTTRRNLDMFQKLVGKDSLKCVVLATTKWSLVDARIGNERQKQLKEQFWKHMVDAGSQIVRIGQDTASREVVNGILGRIDVTKSDINESLAIQEEIVNMGKFIPETEAGQTLQYTIKQLIEAQKRKDDEKARELLERLQKIGKELKIPFTDRIMRFLA